MNILSSIRALYTGPNALFNNKSPKPLYNHEKPWEEDGSSDDNAGQPLVTHEITFAQGFQNRVVSIVDGLGRQIERITNVIGRFAAAVKQKVANEFTLIERCQFFFSLYAESTRSDGIMGRIASIFVKKLEGDEAFMERRRSWETRTIPKNANVDEESISDEEAVADLDSLGLFQTK
ncbi:MAG: hypothetical protein ABSA17_05880 [Rhabdochlamydiaceae bacterium]|jgi:hypothetical protein